MPDQLELAIVVPVYRSKESHQQLIERCIAAAAKADLALRFVMVDDSGFGENDSWNSLRELKQSGIAEMILVKLDGNFGQPIATYVGLLHAKTADLVLTLDDDLQYPPEEIPSLFTTMQSEQADVVLGVKGMKEQRSIVKNIVLNFIKRFVKLTNAPTRYGSSFRMIKGDLISKISDDFNRFIIVDIIFLQFTGNFAYYGIETDDRVEGKSGYSYLDVLVRLTNIIGYYTKIPLRLVVFSLLATIGALLYGTFYLALPNYILLGGRLFLFITFVLLALTILYIRQGFWRQKLKMRLHSKNYIDQILK